MSHFLVASCSSLCWFALAACGAAPSSGKTVDSPAVQMPTSDVDADGHDWTRFGWDAARSNSSTDETGITASNISSLKKQQVMLDGTVDASPIYLHAVRIQGHTRDVFFVTTTYGKTLAIDADSGTILWRYTPVGYDTWAGTRQFTTATPVADPNRQFIYAASPNGHIQKLAVQDGHEVWSTAITLLPRREKIASALNFDRGRVIATTGGYIGDAPPYQGHVAILDATSGRVLHVWNSLCSDKHELIDPSSCHESGSAIWGRAGAVVDPTTGDIFVATGDGKWDGVTYWGDAVIALDSNARMLDNYTPTNTEDLDNSDADLGSTSPVLLGGGLIAQGGKDGSIRLVQFGRNRGTSPRRGGEAQVISNASRTDMFTAPAVIRLGSATWMFAADNGGTAAFTLSGGRLERAWKTDNDGTSPVIAGGFLFVYDPQGRLRIYTPQTGQLIVGLDLGEGHWNSPIIADGRIALPEGDANRHSETGVLNIWRLTH